MTGLPAEAREGAMRAWLSILHDRHPDITWIPAQRQDKTIIDITDFRRPHPGQLPKVA